MDIAHKDYVDRAVMDQGMFPYWIGTVILAILLVIIFVDYLGI